MGKLKLLLVSLLSMLAWNGALAENIETDVTAQFPLDWQGWTGATGFVGWAAPQVTTNDGRTTAACEQYNEGTIAQTGVVFSRKLTGLANGTYTIELYGAAAFTPGRSCSSTLEEGDMTAVYLYAETPAGMVKEYIPAHVAADFNTSGIATAKLENVLVSDGTVTIGMYKDQGLTNWHVVQIKGVTAVVDKDEYLTSLFAPLEAALANGDAVKAKVENEEAIATYEAAVAPYVEANANRTVDYDVTSAVAAVNAAILQLSKYQTADGSDLSGFIVNAEINGADGWTCERPKGGNGPLLGGTSFEYWAGNAQSREEASFDYWQEISGLPNGTYKVSAEMYNSLNGEEGAVWAATCGLYAASGDAEVSALVDADGTTLTSYTTDEIEVTNGKLRIGVKTITTPMVARWFVADNFKLTLVHAKSPYELAMENIKDGQTYRVFTEVNGNKFYLNTAGYLVNDAKKAATFAFNAVNEAGTLYPTGWNLGQKFTNPSLTNGSSGDVVQNGHINVGNNDRNDWERQVFFQDGEGKFAVRATNANSANWGANTYWTVTNTEAELPNADYQLTPAYVWQIEENVDNRPEAFNKTQTWIEKLQAVEGLVQDAAFYSSNAKESREGSYAALLDGDYATFFHSSWSAGAAADHYLQAELPEAAQDFYIYFKKRSQNDNNRPTDIIVSGSNDGENFTQITEITEGLPTGATPIDYTSAKISGTEAYKYLRFTVLATNNNATEGNGHKFFTFSEFYILPSDELTDAALPLVVADYTDLEDEDVPVINELAEKIDALKLQADLAADVAALNELADKLQAQVDATDTYKAEEGVAEDATAVINEVKEATYLSTEEINAAKAKVVDAAKEFFAGITPKADIDITDWYVVNAAPFANSEGWTVTNGTAENQWAGNTYDAANNVAEFWNYAGSKLEQALTLPAGEYKLTAIALTRTDMEGILYAGETNMNIATVGGEVDNRTQASAWFAAGNGVNELEFAMAEAGDVTIGLKSDEATGDHWTVWQSFNLVMVAVAEPEPEEIEIALDVERYAGLGYDPTIVEVDFAEAKEYLGVEEVTTDMLYFVGPDGTWVDYATYAVSPDPSFTYDGWCDAEGAAAQWGETTKINVKFFEAIPDGSFSICDMNGADEVGATYTVKWALKANDKSVIYAVNVTFVKAPTFDLTLEDLEVVTEEDFNVESELGKSYEGLTATVDVEAILNTLEVESLDDVTIAAVLPDGTLDLNYQRGTTDGWRDADGSWKGWTGELETAPYFYVKANFEADPQLQEIGGYPGHTDEDATFTAPYAFIVTGTNRAYVLNVNLIYAEPVESETFEGTIDQTVTIGETTVAESKDVEESISVTPNADGTVNITFAGFSLAAPVIAVNDFTVENVAVTENEDGSKSYSLEDATVTLVAQSGMNLIYDAELTGTQEEGQGPSLTLKLSQRTGMVNTIVFTPTAVEPEPVNSEFAGLIKQVLSHPQTGKQGEATGEQTVTIESAEDGKVNITYSGFTMPVTGAVLPEFTVEGVEVTENEDGSISYALPEDAEAKVVIDRGTGSVTYNVALEGTQENAEAIPVLKLVLESSIIDTVWFAADEKTIDKAIATSINGLNALGAEGTIYDLSGRKVEKIQKGGIYIVNGKKVSIK